MAAQNSTLIRGRVISGISGVKDVLVVNNNAQAETRTDSLGNFSIKAVIGDLFVISDYKVKPIKIRYTQDQVQNNTFIINVEITATELDEVVINKNKKLSAEGLGLIPKGQATYTPAERKYNEQGKTTIITRPNTNGIFIPFEALLNSINGKRKALKENLETERKEGIVNNLNGLYTEDEITQEYKIPKEYVNGFMFYVAEDTGIANYIKFKNNLGLKDRLYELSILYLDSINNDK